MKEISILTIEEEILNLYKQRGEHYEEIAALLRVRKELLDVDTCCDIEEHLQDLREFNEALTNHLMMLWDDAYSVYESFKNVKPEYEYDIKAYLVFGDEDDEESEQTTEQQIFDIICETDKNYQYSGIIVGGLHLPICGYKTFDDWIGNDGKSWNEHLPKEETKDIPLTMMFHQLYDHSLFALSDFLHIRKFEQVIEVCMTK